MTPMPHTNSRTSDKFMLRLPDGMRDQVAQVARQNHRSMNSEIIDRLEQSLLNPRFTPVQEDEVLPADAVQLKSELDRAYKIIDRLLRNATPTQDDIKEVLLLVRGYSQPSQHHIAAVGA